MLPGILIDRRFRILVRAAAGGMGTVYKATDEVDKKTVAVKIVGITNDAAKSRFLREAAMLGSLVHPSVVGYISHGSLDDGAYFLAMEWVEGDTLAAHFVGAELSPKSGCLLAIRLAEALGVAHKRGIVHRDVKPANVLLPGGDVRYAKLVDFGIARPVELETQLTRPGAILGTPGYMSPEQARGDVVIDARADVFALGCILYRALAHEDAFHGKTIFETLHNVRSGTVLPLSRPGVDLPEALDAFVMRMLSPDPERRPRDGDEVAQSLHALIEELSLSDEPHRTGITTKEQRLVSLIVIGGANPTASASESAPTIDVGELDERFQEISKFLLKFSISPELLSDRTIRVVFSGSEVATDQARRAARIAALIRGQFPGAPIAVVTGRVLFEGGHPLGTVVDWARTQLGARLAGVAIDDTTCGLLDGAFEVAKVGDVFELRGVDLATRDDSIVPERTLAFVGRQRELSFLEASLAECVDDETSRGCIVIGAPGIGKSRLISELVKKTMSDRPDVEIIVTRGEVVAPGSPFSLVTRALRAAMRIFDDDPMEARTAKCRRALAELPGIEELERTERALLQLVGGEVNAEEVAKNDAGRRGDDLREAIDRFLAAMSRRGPLLVVIDDLQWADWPSLRIFGDAIREHEGRPLLVVGAGRPELQETFVGLWREHDVTSLALGELSKKACRQLAAEASEATRERIVERSGGNPFFLEELLRFARDRGDELSEDTLPPTVLAMIAARLEGLPPPARRALRAMSLFGLSCHLQALVEVGGFSETEADEVVVTLEREGLIERRELMRFGTSSELLFRNALIRESVYDAFTEADRRNGHALSAEWLERTGESDASVMAEHFEKGGRGSRAAAYFLRAGDRALSGADFDAAIGHSRRGIACGADSALLGDLLLIQIESYGWSGRAREMVEAAESALERVEKGGPAWCHIASAILLNGGGALSADRALALVLETVAHELPVDAHPFEIRFHALVTMMVYRVGQIAMADDIRTRFERLGEEARTRDPSILGWLLLPELYRSRFATRVPSDTVQFARGAIHHFEQAKDRRSLSFGFADLAYSLFALGDLVAAKAAAVRSLEMARKHGVNYVAIFAGTIEATIMGRQGDVDAGRERLARLVREVDASGDRVNQGFTRNFLALLEMDAGNAEAARALARDADRPGVPPTTRAFITATRAHAELALGEHDAALASASEAFDLMSTTNAPEAAETWIYLALLKAQRAKGDPALEESRRAARARLDARIAWMPLEDRRMFLGARDQKALLAEL